MKYCIITGGSKGLGEGLALEYLKQSYKVFSLARTKSTNLNADNQIEIDLNDLSKLKEVFEDLLEKIIKDGPDELILINNAGTLGYVDRIENNSLKSIQESIQLNITVPTVLTSIFISKTKSFSISKAIINISSGAAVSPYFGWGVYCSSKAAIDMLTKVTAIEQESVENQVRVLSIYPGVVDTNMQAQIRSRNKDQFVNIEKFIELKEQNLLTTPSQAAEAIFELYQDPNFKSGSIADVRIN